MKLSAALENYYYLSAKLSDVARQLCFAGIAVIWIFSNKETNGSFSLPSELITPLKFFVASLGLDLLHYTYASLAWGIYHRKKEKENSSPDYEFGAPAKINWPSIFFFWAKVVAVIFGYIYLGGLFF